MNKKEFVQNLRVNKKIKGKRPAYVSMYKNNGGLCNSNVGHFLISIVEDKISFQAFSKWFNVMKPQHDLLINISDLGHFTYKAEGGVLKIITFYTKRGKYLPICYYTGTKDGHETEVNLDYLMTYLKELGVRERNLIPVYEEDEDDEGQDSQN